MSDSLPGTFESLEPDSGAGGRSTPATCGNGWVEDDEMCDRDNLQGETCDSVTLGARREGVLRCTTACTFDDSGCSGLPAGPMGGNGGFGGMNGGGGITSF